METRNRGTYGLFNEMNYVFPLEKSSFQAQATTNYMLNLYQLVAVRSPKPLPVLPVWPYSCD